MQMFNCIICLCSVNVDFNQIKTMYNIFTIDQVEKEKESDKKDLEDEDEIGL